MVNIVKLHQKKYIFTPILILIIYIRSHFHYPTARKIHGSFYRLVRQKKGSMDLPVLQNSHYYFGYLSFLCSWKIHGSFLWLLYHKKGSMDLPVLPNVQVFYCILFFGGRGRSMNPFSYNYVTYKDPWIFHYLQNFSRCRICTHISTSHYEEDERIVNLWVSRESYQKKLVSLDTVGAGLSGPGAPEKWALDGLQ